ncbi:glycosyltransferase, putative [Geotalea daltonii FRC-32]|uniref:Glycosyltransferase, putative n=1 Tax=Geotalea daltonii (strain DSM 22248 / JCM 15807 / FRC-32) TaxID=316067 RepID=B9M579_GEODF|nr:glycosyltransferase [Geotalea daltonii]ACM19834.1 glycosyltransferase, putative [Geotalea daltonii FRC-32]
MRIFYAADNTLNSFFQSNLWRNNLYLSLVDLGHDVVEFRYDLRETFENLDLDDPWQRAFINRNRPKVSAELLRQIKAAHAEKPVDLFFSYFYDACVLPETIDKIKETGIKTVNWYCNGAHQLHRVREISPRYDSCLVPEKFRLKDYRSMGANPLYCQEAANPNIYKPYDLPQEFDVTFVGQAYGERPAYIRYLFDQGLDVRVWGYGWKSSASGETKASSGIYTRISRATGKLFSQEGRSVLRRNLLRALHLQSEVVLPEKILGEPLSDLEMIKMYSRSKINIGFSACGDTHQSGERIVQVRLRDFEVPMSGGFYMVEYMEELEEFFTIGKEIVCYTGPEDLAEKIRYYLSHDSEREAIRKAGYERCLRDHTWQKRLSNAFQQLNLPTIGTQV